jgi:hypothetical protein
VEGPRRRVRAALPKGFVVSFVAFHERGFSIPIGRFIRGILFEYKISAHWHLFQYFFKFACLKEGSWAATISCANLRMKQGRDEDYIPVSLTSSNNGWHKVWFYLPNDPEFALPVYTGNSIAESRRNWSDGPAKMEQEKMLRDHWAVL